MSKLSKYIKKSPIAKSLKYGEKKISSVIPHEHSADRREALRATREQIDLYRQQKEMMQQEATRVEGERRSERRRIQEKQIRSRKSAMRSTGFLDEASGSTSDMLG